MTKITEALKESMIQEAYTKVKAGMKRVDFELPGWSVKAYKAGLIIRIDIKEEDE